MQSQLTPFDFQGTTVRVVTDESGEPWFVLADLCSVLGIENAGNVADRMADDEVRRATIRLAEGSREVTRERPVVNEPGMWRVILRSDSPAAEPVRRWVTHEVLPAIRRTGSYSTAPVAPLTEIEVARRWVTALEERDEARAQVAALAPRAELADTYLSATGDYSVAEAAKILSRDHRIATGQDRLFTWLAANGWTVRHGGRPAAEQTRITRGHMTARATTYTHPRTGATMAGAPQVRITPRGLQLIAAAMSRELVTA